MNAVLENAQRIFEVARADSSAESADFALLVLPDGSLHAIMEQPVSLEAAAIHHGARSAFHVIRRRGEVRVEGRGPRQVCILETRQPSPSLPVLRDQPLYRITSPLLTAGS